MVPLLAEEDLQQKVHFLRAAGAAVAQLEALGLAEGAAVSQTLHKSVRVRDGLHQVLVTFLQQLFMLRFHLFGGAGGEFLFLLLLLVLVVLRPAPPSLAPRPTSLPATVSTHPS